MYNTPPPLDPIFSAAKACTLFNELHVYQAELERQNEALLLEQQALKEQANRLRKLVLELTSTEQCERHQMALVMHEHIQQCLVGARIHLEVLQKMTEPTKHQQISQVMAALKEGFESCRSLTKELCPLMVYDAGLIHAIRSLVAYLHHQHGLLVNVQSAADCRMWDNSVSLILYGAVRALLLNVIKHAGVKEAEVHLSLTKGDQIQIVVKDQGQGFDPAHLQDRNGLSRGLTLFKLRERLDLLGGRMDIQSAPGKGSQFTLQVTG